MKKYLIALLAVCLLLAMALPAYALEYSFEEAESPNYGKPSSVEPVVTALRLRHEQHPPHRRVPDAQSGPQRHGCHR